MTIADNYTPIRTLGDGVTTNFGAAWSMISSAYALVQLEDATSGVLTTVNQGAGSNQYQIAITTSGFTVTMGTAPTASQYINVSRVVTKDQSTPYKTSKGFQGSVEEASFDKLTALVQQISSTLGQNIKVPLGDSATNLTLPKASLRASSYLAFDASGNVVTMSGISGTSISSAMTPVVQAASLPAGRTALGAAGLADNNTFTGANVLTATSINGGQLAGFHNRIINGNMLIDQRLAGASLTPTTDATYCLDRWLTRLSQPSKFSVQQNAGGVTAPAGFSKYLGVTSLSAYSVGASEFFGIAQVIEGLNITDLNWGSANAKPISLSFWVRSSLTGLHSGTLFNGSGTRCYVFSYTISVANTWQYVTLLIPGDTTGTWLITNGAGLSLQFNLGAGATVSGAAGAWGGTFYDGVTGGVSVVGTNTATFYITGVQIEVGTIPSLFEHRGYGAELFLCQRYFETTYNGVAVPTNAQGSYVFAPSASVANTTQLGFFTFNTTKRITPTMTTYSYTSSTTNKISDGGGTDLAANSGGPAGVSPNHFWLNNTSGGAIIPALGGFIIHYKAEAEL